MLSVDSMTLDIVIIRDAAHNLYINMFPAVLFIIKDNFNLC